MTPWTLNLLYWLKNYFQFEVSIKKGQETKSWEPAESVSSCFIYSGRSIWHWFHSGWFHSGFKNVRAITTFYQRYNQMRKDSPKLSYNSSFLSITTKQWFSLQHFLAISVALPLHLPPHPLYFCLCFTLDDPLSKWHWNSLQSACLYHNESLVLQDTAHTTIL